MEEYSQTPPEGLWEAVEAGLPARRRAFPWVWALAGVAAVLLAVVALWRPAETVSPAAIAVADNKAAVETAGEELSAPLPGGASTSEAAAPASERKMPAAEQAESKKNVSEKAEETMPAGKAETTENTEPTGNAELTEKDEPAEERQPAEETKPAEKEKHAGNTQTLPVEIIKPARRSKLKPVASGALLASALPGEATSSYGSYGIPKAASTKGVMRAPVALLSRNKPSQTDVHHSVAYRVGAMFNLSLTEHWGMESGLQLTNLQTRTKTVTGDMSSIKDRTISYVGIPLLAVYTPLRYKNFSLYASAGPMFEYGFRSFGKLESYIGDQRQTQDRFTEKESDTIFSLGANLGAQWYVPDMGALFVQPGLSWHIAGEGNTESFYTKHPLSFGITAGFRFLF